MKEVKDTLDNIFSELKDIKGSQEDIKIIQTRHEENLKEHMRRTELLEEEFHPVKKHVEQVRGAGKLIALLAMLATIASVIFVAIQ